MDALSFKLLRQGNWVKLSAMFSWEEIFPSDDLRHFYQIFLADVKSQDIGNVSIFLPSTFYYQRNIYLFSVSPQPQYNFKLFVDQLFISRSCAE